MCYITTGNDGHIEEVDVDFGDNPGKCPSAGEAELEEYC